MPRSAAPMPRGPRDRDQPLYRRAVSYIERLFTEYETKQGLLQKEVAFAAGLAESVYSQKLRGIRSHFTEDEFEAVAVFFRGLSGRPLIGFPHLEWSLMEACDRQVGGWKPHRTH